MTLSVFSWVHKCFIYTITIQRKLKVLQVWWLIILTEKILNTNFRVHDENCRFTETRLEMFHSFTLMWHIKVRLFSSPFQLSSFFLSTEGSPRRRQLFRLVEVWGTADCICSPSLASSASLRGLRRSELFGLEAWGLKRCLLSVKTVGLFPRRCLTCELNKAHCLHIDADISPAKQHVILRCEGRTADSLFSAFNPLFLLKPSHWTQPSDVSELFSVRLLLFLSSDINFQ